MGDLKGQTSQKFRFSWRSLTVWVLAAAGLAALTGALVVHWTERQILTTDNWVQVVAPLPKNDAVASALSTYAVNQLYTATDLEDRITQALPDRAAFLAPTLSDQLQTRLTNRTKQVIQSDRFQSIWETANRAASQRLLTTARNPESATQKRTARFSLDLSSLRETVSSILNERTGRDIAPVNADSNKNVGVAVGLKASVKKIHQYIRLIDFLNATLWLFAVVCLLGAIVLSRSRRYLLLALSSIMVVISLLQIIGVKALRPYIINQIQDSSFRPAVSVIYDTLVASFRNGAVTAFTVSTLLFVLILVLHKPLLIRSKHIANWFKDIQRSRVWRFGVTARQFIGKYRYQLMAVAAVLVLTLLAFAVKEFSASIGARGLLSILLFVELISLFGLRNKPRGKPMKQ